MNQFNILLEPAILLYIRFNEGRAAYPGEKEVEKCLTQNSIYPELERRSWSFKRVAKGLKKESKTIALYEWSLEYGSKREQDDLSIIDLIGIWVR